MDESTHYIKPQREPKSSLITNCNNPCIFPCIDEKDEEQEDECYNYKYQTSLINNHHDSQDFSNNKENISINRSSHPIKNTRLRNNLLDKFNHTENDANKVHFSSIDADDHKSKKLRTSINEGKVIKMNQFFHVPVAKRQICHNINQIHNRSKDHENLEFDQNQKLHISIPLNLSKNKNAGDFRSARVKMASNTWYKLVEDDYNYKENHHSFRKHKRVFETYSSKKMNRSQKIIHNINPNEQQYYEKYNFDITPTNLRKEILEFVEQPKIIVVKSGIIVNNDTNFNGNYMINSSRSNCKGQNFNSKVEIFDPKEFENRSDYSDNSISRSIKKNKAKREHSFKAKNTDEHCHNQNTLCTACSKRNFPQEKDYITKDTEYLLNHLHSNCQSKLGKVIPFENEEFNNQNDNVELPDLPYKRKYHRLYKKREQKDLTPTENEEILHQASFKEKANKKAKIITQENLRKMQMKSYSKHKEKNNLYLEEYEEEQFNEENEGNIEQEQTNDHIESNNVSKAAKSFRRFRSNLYKKMENKGYHHSSSAIDTSRSVPNCYNENLASRSNSVSKNSGIFDNHESVDNSPISVVDTNTSRLERRKQKTIDRINNFSSDPSMSYNSKIFSEERKERNAVFSEERQDHSNVIESLRRSKSKRLKDISNDACNSNVSKSNCMDSVSAVSDYSVGKKYKKSPIENSYSDNSLKSKGKIKNYNVLCEEERNDKEDEFDALPQSRIQQIKNKYGNVVEVAYTKSIKKETNEERIFIKTETNQNLDGSSKFKRSDMKSFNKNDLKINLDQVLKVQQNKFNNIVVVNNQECGDSLRELKQDEGPLLTFDKKRREAGNKNQDSFDDSQNKSTSRFGDLNNKKNSGGNNKKEKVKTHRDTRQSKKKSVNFTVKRSIRKDSVSPFVNRIKIEKKKQENLKKEKSRRETSFKSNSNKPKRKKINSINGKRLNKVMKEKEKELMNKFNIAIKSDSSSYSQICDLKVSMAKTHLAPLNNNPEVIVEEDNETSKTITTILNAPTPDSFYRHDPESSY